MENETEQIFVLNFAESQPSGSTQTPGVVEVPSSQLNLENVEDFSRVCRTCATITEFVIPIFGVEGETNNLAPKINKHLPIQVSEDDVMPRVMCYQCASTLLAWHELVACCEQAEAALRARLATVQQEPTTTDLISDSNQKEADDSQLSVTDSSPPEREPPEYRSPRRSCSYCSQQLPPAAYKEHLVTAHADLLFHCEECGKYIDRKDFILHMSLHAVQYTNGFDKKDKKRRVKLKKEDTDVNQNTRELCNTEIEGPMQDLQISDGKTEYQQNEFSDQSDAENDFGPIPESVFEAIEDSQDSQPLEEDSGPTPENEQLSDESNKSDEPTQDNANMSNSFVMADSNDVSNPAFTPIETNVISTQTPVENTTINSLPLQEETIQEETSEPIAPDPKTINETVSPERKKYHKKTRTCPICSKVYTASSSYFYHMKYFHKGSKEHECSVCNKKFGTKAYLIQHLAVHSGQYKFECKHCKKKFKCKSSLYIHEQTHTGKKTWSCDQCQISFRWKTHLVRHMKRHSAEKAHVCTTCGRGFNIRCDLLRHARTHTAGNFTCEKCDLKFAQLRYLKVHIVKKHSTDIG